MLNKTANIQTPYIYIKKTTTIVETTRTKKYAPNFQGFELS